MEIFMFVTKVGSDRLETVDLALAKGDRIRVTAGIFKGQKDISHEYITPNG